MAETKADNPSSSTYLHPTPEKKKREKTKTIGHLRQPVNKFKRKSPYHKVTQEKSPPLPPLLSDIQFGNVLIGFLWQLLLC